MGNNVSKLVFVTALLTTASAHAMAPLSINSAQEGTAISLSSNSNLNTLTTADLSATQSGGTNNGITVTTPIAVHDQFNIGQVGSNNQATINAPSASLYDDVGRIVQTGSGNTAAVTFSGTGNDNANQFQMIQNGNNNQLHAQISGTANSVSAVTTGNNNTSTLNIGGGNNIVNTSVTGNSNSVQYTTNSSDNNRWKDLAGQTPGVTLNGSNNSAAVTIGSLGAASVVSSVATGNNNTQIQNINAFETDSVIHQTGVNNYANVSVNGPGAYDQNNYVLINSAGSNTDQVQVTGGQNAVSIQQGNASTSQFVTNDLANVIMTGSDGSANIKQMGNADVTTYMATGYSDSFTATQMGDGDNTTVIENGNSNVVGINQYAASSGAQANNNAISMSIAGNSNTAQLSQTGNSNIMTATLAGNSNSMTNTQQGDNNNMNVAFYGSNNTGTFTQVNNEPSTPGNSLTYSYTGSGKTVTISQIK